MDYNKYYWGKCYLGKYGASDFEKYLCNEVIKDYPCYYYNSKQTKEEKIDFLKKCIEKLEKYNLQHISLEQKIRNHILISKLEIKIIKLEY